uniref:G_PROTEIN_RECEP_F1_2 domain-containing protein n=1 Tax=Onchocerca volvulus TaxID=6282 RepID=A0A8R1TMG5_ONCVO
MAIAESSLDENILALLCIVVISVLGLVGNGLSLHITITNSTFQNAYGTLRTATLLCNIQTISIIMIWGAIVLLMNSRESSSPTSFNALIPGCLTNVSLYGSVLLYLLISANRYCAFAFPLKYHLFWSIAKARKAVIIVYFLGFLPCFPSLFEPCTLIFNTKLDFRWSYSDTTCGYINSIFDTVTVTSAMIIGGCFDFVTLLKIKKFKKRKQSFTSSIKRKHEIFFFKQSCISGITMIISAVVFNIGQKVLTNKWALFAVSTIGWEMAHVLDG